MSVGSGYQRMRLEQVFSQAMAMRRTYGPGPEVFEHLAKLFGIPRPKPRRRVRRSKG